MPSKSVYFQAIPGFADWEAGHALAEVRRNSTYEVTVVGRTRDPVESMGGLKVLPDMPISDVDLDGVALFVLPGGERWEREPVDPTLADLLNALDARSTPIAAICAATTGRSADWIAARTATHE